MTAFAKNLKRLRKLRKLTQRDLGVMAEMSPVQVSHYEASRREPNLENLRALKEALNCEYKEFFIP